MMNNILSVTAYLKRVPAAEGKDPDRYTLTVIPTRSGESFVQADDAFYRAYAFIEGSVCYVTLECGMRFLADDLNGDVYFRIHKDRHNLIRARNQIKQAVEIEKMLPELHKIVNDCLQN